MHYKQNHWPDAIYFEWEKGNSSIEGNELLDRLANAATVEDRPAVYHKIPREVIVTRAKEMDWHCGNSSGRLWGNGAVPTAWETDCERNTLYPQFTSMVTGRGELRSYCYVFAITDSPMCGVEQQRTGLQSVWCFSARNCVTWGLI
jgi:hypothetical protein